MRPTLALILPVGSLKLGLEETEKPADLLCSLKLSTSCKLCICKSRPVLTSTFLPDTVEPIIVVSCFALSCANCAALIVVGT